MDFFFEPNGVAVVGATPETYSGGRYLITNLTLGYPGPIYPVNPKYHEVLGLKCYPSVREIDGPLDLALIFVPAQAVPQVLRDCAAKGVRGAILQSSGFAEVGPDGKALQDQCLTIAQQGGLRIWGPNCMGLIDTSKRYVFSFMVPGSWQEAMNPGGVSLIVQSGLLSAGFITTLMANKTLGLAKVCSIGNRSDVEESELLEYLLKDPATKVIALYLESFIHGRRFYELAAASEKPIVVLKGGKTSLGAEASASHTASLAGNNELIRGALRQAGLHQADDFFEMVDMARTLEKDFSLQNPPEGKGRIAILSYSGAAGIVTTDHMVADGLTLAQLSPKTLGRLKELAPAWMPVKNPVDYYAATEKHGPALAYSRAIEALHDDPEVDGMIVHLFAGFGVWFLNMKEIMAGIKNPRKPILFWLIGPQKGEEATRMTLEEMGWPVFHEIHRVARVMASLFDQGKKGKKDLEISPIRFPISQSLKKMVDQADKGGSHRLDEHEAKKWLKTMGLNVVKEMTVKDLEETLKAAEKMGYPVVLKGRVEGRIHKTEAGLVKLNLWNSNQIRLAYKKMLKLKPKPQSFLVQPMLKGDFELIAGITRDPQFGPAVMLGLGGIHAEVYRDVAFRLPPLSEKDVSDMASELKGQALLKGYRGSKPVNMKRLADWLIKLGELVLRFEKIQEMDVNPLLIVDGEPIAVDATILLRSHLQT
jgi:acetate---CoA ligase (ADP-forming)